MATMEVILATKIEGLGAEADLVTVKAGYGRNYLIPKGLAHEATASNRRFIANLQAARAKREAEELSAAQEVAAKISGLTVDLTLEVGQGGKAFGAITNQNIHDALTAQGVEVDRRAIELEKPIKSEGEHEVVIKVHPQVDAQGGRQGKRLRGAHPFSGRPGSHLGNRASFCHPFYFPSLNKQGIMPALGVTQPHARHRSIPPPKSTA